MPVLIQINSIAGVKIAFEKLEFSIGRGEENDLRIDDDLVSRRHAIIDCSRKPDSNNCDWILRDQGSTNGTYVNDRRVTVHALVDGEVLRIGKTFLKFFSNDSADLGETRVMKKSFIPGIYYTKGKP